MCVILTADDTRLPARTIREAVERNRDGIGLAWIETGAVRWRKGLSLRDALDLASDVPTPYVLHARIATVGGIRPALCHPFPVVRAATGLETDGRNRTVLFHNGHWSDWRKALTEFIDGELPDGPWSDSRAMAYLGAFYGAQTVAEMVGRFVGQRVALLSAKHGVQRYGTWHPLGRGVWASNTYGLTPIEDARVVYRDHGPAAGRDRFVKVYR